MTFTPVLSQGWKQVPSSWRRATVVAQQILSSVPACRDEFRPLVEQGLPVGADDAQLLGQAQVTRL